MTESDISYPKHCFVGLHRVPHRKKYPLNLIHTTSTSAELQRQPYGRCNKKHGTRGFCLAAKSSLHEEKTVHRVQVLVSRHRITVQPLVSNKQKPLSRYTTSTWYNIHPTNQTSKESQHIYPSIKLPLLFITREYQSHNIPSETE